MEEKDHVHQITGAEAYRLDAQLMEHRGRRQKIVVGLRRGEIVFGEEGLVVENAAYPSIGRVGIDTAVIRVIGGVALGQRLGQLPDD